MDKVLDQQNTLMPHATILSFIVLIYYRIKDWFSSINLRVISVL